MNDQNPSKLSELVIDLDTEIELAISEGNFEPITDKLNELDKEQLIQVVLDFLTLAVDSISNDETALH